MTTLATPEATLRIGIEAAVPTVTILMPGGGDLVDEKNRRVKSFRSGERFSWSVSQETPPSKKQDRRASRKKSVFSSLAGRSMRFQPKQGTLSLNGRAYRGVLEVSFGRSGATVVNLVGMEDYVKGVVGSEIGSLSPEESLKAQAVIARTFAIASRGKHQKDGYDLCDREHCQVYGGVKAERASVSKAVDATRGIIMISDGVPISTMYHATCGGMTSDNEKVYGGAPTKYLRRVRCDYCKAGTKYRWQQHIDLASLRKALASERLGFERLYAVEAIAPAPLDRVDLVKLQTDRGELRVKGTTFRRLFNLPSTTFVVPALEADPRPRVGHPSPSVGSGAPPKTALPVDSVSIFAGGKQSGPPQLIVQTAQGIRRAKRPSSGWIVVAGRRQALDTSLRRGLLLKSGTRELTGIDLSGRGFGHQVGLCQSGAIELGRRGWSYRQILALYYSHVALRQLRYEAVPRRK
ncbi:MAG TPA: SpoIID/LytB domain-containing protein [Candidatus Ozemobacteraceae bacterium]|nr:SpoIID/LytB domain-containing protein [Candidatus Ozemobacteraceae bacterium]